MTESDFFLDLYIPRPVVEAELRRTIYYGRPAVLLGHAGVGKTTLLRHLVRSMPEAKALFISAHDEDDLAELQRRAEQSEAKLIVIDDLDRLGAEKVSLMLRRIRDTSERLNVPAILSMRPRSHRQAVPIPDAGHAVYEVIHLENPQDSELDRLSELRGRLGIAEQTILENELGTLALFSAVTGEQGPVLLFGASQSEHVGRPSQTQLRLTGVLNDLLAKTLRLESLTPRELEILVAELLEEDGCKVKLTKASRDDGVDVIALFNGPAGEEIYFVEAKTKQNLKPISVSPVRELYGVVQSNQANKGMLVTTATFSKPAVALAAKHPTHLELRDCDRLATWISSAANRRQTSVKRRS